MHFRTDDIRVEEIRPLITPDQLQSEFPSTERAETTVAAARAAVCDILHGRDERLLVIVGPCSIHDTDAAIEYAGRLKEQRDKLGASLEILMRVYFEKPRTTVGWKGLINDPHLDDSYCIDEGLGAARKLLLAVNELGLPVGTEYLDMISPQYISGLVGWGAIGARTTESQVHRELVSGLSCPVGFKNGTDGNIRIAVDAIQAAGTPHHFLGVTKGGIAAIVKTKGNPDCHVILRGGERPNYDSHSVREVCELLAKKGLAQKVMIDASHANSGKNPEMQVPICAELGIRIAAGDESIMGVMIESNLIGGRQELIPGKQLTYGQSITDGCLSWEQTVDVLEGLASASDLKRSKKAQPA